MNLKLTAIPIDDIKIGPRFRQDLGDIAVLAASIQTNTLLHPIVVSREHVLIVGRRRLEACMQLGWTRIPAQVIDFDEAPAAEQDENEVRKDFTPSEKVAIGEVREEQEREEAKARQAQAGPQEGRGKKTTGCENFTQPVTGRVREIAAKAVGWSGPTYDKAKAVVHAARENPNYARVVEEMDRTGNVSKAYRDIPEHLRAPKSSPTNGRKRKPLRLETMTLRLDRFIEKIVPDVQYLDDFEFERLITMLEHYTHLLQTERKACLDAAHD